MDNQKFLKTGQVAKILKVNRETIRLWTKNGIIIPDHTINGYNYFSEQKILEFCQTAKNLLPNSQNCQKSPTIKNKTAKNLREVFLARFTSINFKRELPTQYHKGVTKLMTKLQLAQLSQDFKTSFNKDKTLLTFARLDGILPYITSDIKFDAIDELILNAIYSFVRDGHQYFTSRRLLQHIFGNINDHFQKEIVETIEEHIEKLTYMKLTYNFKDNLGNDSYVLINGEQYHPVAIRENLLDIAVLELKSVTLKKPFLVYQIKEKSPIFKYAECFNQITSWSTEYMAVPCRKTLQNALIVNYLLTKISLMKNKHNNYVNNGILFETIYEDLKLDVNTRDKKKNIRNNIKMMFDYWIEAKLLISYEFVKSGQAFYKIVFKIN